MRSVNSVLLTLAQQSPTDGTSLPAGTTGFGVQLFQSALALIGVCVGAWLVLRWMAKRGYGGGAGRNLRVIERVMLEPRRSVYLVEAGTRVFLIGSSDQSVTTLAELSRADLTVPPPAREGAGTTAPVATTPAARFVDVLARIRNSGSHAHDAPSTARENTEPTSPGDSAATEERE